MCLVWNMPVENSVETVENYRKLWKTIGNYGKLRKITKSI